MQGINVAGKDCIDLFFNTHVFLTFISLNIHLMFSYGLIPGFLKFHIDLQISGFRLVRILDVLYLSIKSQQINTFWDFNLHAIKSY